MDSDRRHQLAQNSLGNWLVDQYDDFIKPNSQLIGWVVIGFLVFLIGMMLTVSMVKTSNARAWQQYFSAFGSDNPEASFQALVESVPTGPTAAQARLTFAQFLTGDATNLLTTDKAKAEEKLETALRMLDTARSTAKDEFQQQQLLFGKATAFETLAACRSGKNDLAEAEKAYKEIAQQWPNSYYGQRAQRQLTVLERPDTRKFYDQVAAIVPETPKADEFKVDIDKKDAFSSGPTSFDPAKAVGGASALSGGLDSLAPSTTPAEPMKEEPKKEEPAPTTEEKKTE